MISIGHSNFVKIDDIAAILSPDNAPAKKLRQKAAEENRLLAANAGRKTRSIIVLKSNQVVLSSLSPEAVKTRVDEILAQNPKTSG